MILRPPSKRFVAARSGLKFFIYFEGALIVSSYILYSACNRSQKTRKFFHDHFPLNHILEFYYKAGELYGTETVRKFDRITWKAENALKEKKENQT